MIRRPIEPITLLERIAVFHFALALLQLTHLSIFAQSQAQDFAAWLIINAIAYVTIFILKKFANGSSDYILIPWRPLAVLLLMAFMAKFFSRIPYIESWIAEGLYATRSNEELGGGGALSFINIFFYPAAILLAFTELPQKRYHQLITLVSAMCLTDFLILGTRNAPLFVLLFHFLAYPKRINPRQKLFIFGMICLFVILFSYSTENRTQESQLGTFDWLVVFEFSGSTENLKIDRKTAETLAENLQGILPVIFLSHYVTHSLSEFAYVFSKLAELQLGGLYYLTDQLCVVGICSRSESLSVIESVNPRAGIYQTAWISLIFDFGVFGALLIWLMTLIGAIISLKIRKKKVITPGFVLFAVLVSLSPIENYLYNGLGLMQCFLIIISAHLLKLSAFIRSSLLRLN